MELFDQQHDLFACGVHEPCASATVCDAIGIDDLIIVGIIAAASIAASQISASENESAANDMTKQREQFALRQQQINFHKNQQDRAGRGVLLEALPVLVLQLGQRQIERPVRHEAQRRSSLTRPVAVVHRLDVPHSNLDAVLARGRVCLLVAGGEEREQCERPEHWFLRLPASRVAVCERSPTRSLLYQS